MITEVGTLPEKAFALEDVEKGPQFSKKLERFKKQNFPLVYISLEPSDIEFLTPHLLALRAENFSFILLLKPTLFSYSTTEVIDFLEQWDSLLLYNLLELFPLLKDARFQRVLSIESKIEMMWFRQWNLALSDPRITKYPSLPWRSYLRKINFENAKLSKALLQAKEEQYPSQLEMFLLDRKKVVCLFPKNWAKA